MCHVGKSEVAIANKGKSQVTNTSKSEVIDIDNGKFIVTNTKNVVWGI